MPRPLSNDDGHRVRAGGRSEDQHENAGSSVSVASLSVAAQLNRCRRAGWRLPPLACGHRDPWDCRAHPSDAPDSFGLTTPELWAEIRRCQRAGWQPWELRRRFANPRALTPAEGAAS